MTDIVEECHCGKDGHALGSINCPVHGLPFAAIDNLTHHQEQCDMDGVMVKVSRQALDEVLRYLSTQSPSQSQTTENTGNGQS